MAAETARFRIERKRGAEVRAAELVLGTHSSCDLVLDDPIAAERHCALALQGGRFVLRDLGSATGTYLNGAPVLAPVEVAPGDRIALGVTKVDLRRDAGDDAATLVLAVDEGGFFFTAKKREEFASDADEWVRSEVRFGASVTLRVASWAAAALALAACAAFLLMPAGRAAVEPGALASVHAALFASDPPASLDPGALALAREQGCAVCHDTFGRPSAAKCAACHAEVVDGAVAGARHPFEAGDALDCTRCHGEHHGAAPPPGTLQPADMAGLCADCHGDDLEDEAGLSAALSAAAERLGLARARAAAAPRAVPVGYEGFRHAAHASVTDCTVCHVETTGDPAASLDHAPVDFERCVTCHGEGAPEDRPWRPEPEHLVATAWHGAGADGAHCEQCHAEAHEAPLRTVERLAPGPLAFSMRIRSHADLLHTGPRSDECSRCHRRQDVLWDGRLYEERVFRHDLHLSTVAPADEGQRAALQAQCAACHVEVVGSSALTAAPAAFGGPPLDRCAGCHKEGEAALITAPGAPRAAAVAAGPVAIPDFPHDRHGLDAVPGGCMECHTLAPSGAEPGLVLAGTTPAARACVSCHLAEDRAQLAHAAIGGGDCATCHPSAGDRMSAVFYTAPPTPPRERWFPHRSPMHATVPCVTCHGDPAVDPDVRVPGRDAALCLDCHARNRFHWR